MILNFPKTVTPVTILMTGVCVFPLIKYFLSWNRIFLDYEQVLDQVIYLLIINIDLLVI